MTTRDLVNDVVGGVAPDVADEVGEVDPTIDFWEELDLDSMDHLNVMTELGGRLGIEIPDRDYGRLRTMGSLVAYLDAAAAS